MTPNERLSDADKKLSLSCILKPFMPGNLHTMTSAHITDAPRTQAGAGSAYCFLGRHSHEAYRDLPSPLMAVMIHPRVSFGTTMVAKLETKASVWWWIYTEMCKDMDRSAGA